MKKIITMLSLLAAVTSCTKEQFGTTFGAVGGGVVGSMIGKGNGQVAATLIGAAGGAYLGHKFGANMDQKDRQYNANTTVRTLETARSGHVNSWRNPETGHSGTVLVNRTYQRSNGEYCREFTQKINIGGKVESGYGTACRQQDGSWKIVQ